MAIKKTDTPRPAWISSLPKAYWKSLEESEQSPPEPALEAVSAEAKALDHYYAFQQRQGMQERQSSLMKKSSGGQPPLTGNRNANLQDANRRYTTLYDRRQNDRRGGNTTAAASDSFNTNRRKTRGERRAMSQQVSLFRLASLRDSALSEEAIPLPYTAPLMVGTPEPIRIEGLDYPVSITGMMMQIGTATLTQQEWATVSDNVILDNYGRKLLNFWREHRDMLLAMAKEKA